jgi:hypothetical protein
MAAQVGASLLTYATVVVAHSRLPVHSWVELLALVGLGGLVYTLALATLSPGFRATFGGAVRDSLADRSTR